MFARRLLGFLVMLGTGASPAALAAESGNINFELRSHDFGQVVRGQQLKYRFKFKNSGDGPLKIQGVHAACGCTAVVADKDKVYQAQETGYIDLTLDTTDFSGPMMKVVTVMTNEGITPERILTVRAQVLSEYDVQPPLVDFGDVVSKAGAVRVVKVSAIGEFPLEVSKVDFPEAIVDVVTSRNGMKREWTITTTLKPLQKPGFLKDIIVLRTNSKVLPTLEIPIRGTIRGNIAMAPAYLEFGAITQKESSKREIVLSGLDEFKITGTNSELVVNGKLVKDAKDYVTVDIEDNPEARKRLAIALNNVSEAGGSVHGKVYLSTNDQAQPRLEVDFYAFFR